MQLGGAAIAFSLIRFLYLSTAEAIDPN